MGQSFNFDAAVLNSVVGGVSALDMPKLNIRTLAEADAFVQGYGFDITQEKDVERLWYYYRRALVLITEKLEFKLSEIPEVMRDSKSVNDLRNLLLWASDSEDSEKQKWACAILRVMHVFTHAENDLFSTFSEEIQKQILTPIQDSIFHEGSSGTTFLKNSTEKMIALSGFEVKPFKTSSSTVIKLLAKPTALAMSVFDKLGFRFVTNNVYDSFRVVRYLVEYNLISYPHIMPEQSSNNLYPVDLFLSVIEESKSKQMNPDQINQLLEKKLLDNRENISFLRKENTFSGEDYRFIKFICRKLIKVKSESSKKEFSFFYPFEVQIMDMESHQKILSGPSHHQAYKDRQITAARERLFPTKKVK